MDDLCRYADRPFAFLARYLRHRPWSHARDSRFSCSLPSAVRSPLSMRVKFLVDTLAGHAPGDGIWLAFLFLASLIAADNLLWRLASWIASYAFVGVTGDMRRDLFRHLTGHAPSYFSDRLPGMLTSRITATSNAVFTVENMFVWNVLPPCVATVGAIAFVLTVSGPMAAVLIVVAGIVVIAMFRLAAAGKPLHHDFADKAAAVDGEMIDVIGNMPIVRAFGGLVREHRRFDATVEREMGARRRSLLYLERLRLLHAVVTVVLTIGLLAWAIVLWQRGAATTGDVVLVCTLGLSVLHATRDLAVALVDVTQHMARLSEALATLLIPHELRDHPEAAPLVRRGASVVFEDVSFAYPDGRRVFANFNLRLEPGQRVGLVGRSGGGKSTLFALLQRFYDVQSGRILIDGQDIARVTQESLRAAIAVVPQDISLFHRSIMENIRYGRPEACDEDVLEAAVAAQCYDFIEAARRPRHDGRRSRREAVRRPAPAHRHRARLPEGRADPAARRGDLRARQRLRGGDPRGPGPADAGPHRDRDRASAVDRAQLRSHRRAAGRARRPGRRAGPPDPARRPLSRAGHARDEPADEASGMRQ